MTTNSSPRLDTKAGDDGVLLPAIRGRRTYSRDAIIQTLILLVIVGAIGAIVELIRKGLQAHGIGFNFDFLAQPATFELSEGRTLTVTHSGVSFPQFESWMNNGQALLTGLYNTLLVTCCSAVAATSLGVLWGVTRMSSNWVVKKTSWALVELIRDTPLLIQIPFWYFVVVLQLPTAANGSILAGLMIASRQGLYVPRISFHSWSGVAITMLGSVIALPALKVTTKWHISAVLAIATACGISVCFLLSMTGSFDVSIPEAHGFAVDGGKSISPEMTSLIIAISVNTAAYIAEILRGAILSIDKGQSEAAWALGISPKGTLRFVVLPQALRVLIPSLGNQLISLSKNTSFAIVIGFPDLFSVYGTVANQTGRSLEGIVLVMLAYFSISMIVSAVTNQYNKRNLQRGAHR